MNEVKEEEVVPYLLELQHSICLEKFDMLFPSCSIILVSCEKNCSIYASVDFGWGVGGGGGFKFVIY